MEFTEQDYNIYLLSGDQRRAVFEEIALEVAPHEGVEFAAAYMEADKAKITAGEIHARITGIAERTIPAVSASLTLAFKRAQKKTDNQAEALGLACSEVQRETDEVYLASLSRAPQAGEQYGPRYETLSKASTRMQSAVATAYIDSVLNRVLS